MRKLTKDERLILQEAIRIKRRLQESAGTYWGESGKYQSEADELEKLVPPSGPAETLNGEIWRAATKIYYDYHNNGFGNNWSGPATFLMTWASKELPYEVKAVLKNYMFGKVAERDLDVEMEQMIDATIEHIKKRDPRTRNTFDMWDYQKKAPKTDRPRSHRGYDDDDLYGY